MKTGQGPSMVAYNVQTAVDAKHKLVVQHEVINEATDNRSLLPMATAAQRLLGSNRATPSAAWWDAQLLLPQAA
jgi:hypothetical protein